MTFSGDAARFPNIRFIWSHAGGSAPFLAGRIDGASSNAKDRLPEWLHGTRRKSSIYDTAGAANRGALASLLELVTPAQILFGTDFPPGGTSGEVARLLAELGMFDASAPARDRTRERGPAPPAAQSLVAVRKLQRPTRLYREITNDALTQRPRRPQSNLTVASVFHLGLAAARRRVEQFVRLFRVFVARPLSTLGSSEMRQLELAIAGCLLVSAAASMFAAVQGPASTSVTLFEGGRLIAGDGGAPIESSAFLVENGRFTRVARKGEVQAPAGAARVDLTGKTVIPALIDAHSHIGYMKNLTSGPQNYTRDNILDHMRRFAYFGVAASQAMGSDFGDLPFQLRDELQAGQSPTPRGFSPRVAGSRRRTKSARTTCGTPPTR